jgi:DNA-directed RNA polymerase subunit RPC12/RpoP
MADSKISCPKCNGHIVFPNEMAGQAIACPHCNETFFLPKAKSVFPWIITAAFALVTICLGSLLVFQHQKSKKETQVHTFSKSSSVPDEAAKAQTPTVAQKSADDQAIETLCRKYYDALSSQNAQSLYELLSGRCKKVLMPKDITIDGAKYEFINLESVKGTSQNPYLCRLITSIG